MYGMTRDGLFRFGGEFRDFRPRSGVFAMRASARRCGSAD
jgi:hypothetical protein